MKVFLSLAAFALVSISNSYVDEHLDFFDIVKHQYLSFNESQIYLEKLVRQIREVNPQVLVNVEVEGVTYENRSIKSYTFQYKGKSKNPIIIIDAGSHGREWHSQSMAFYFMRKLITEAMLKDGGLLSKFTFVIIPTVNPDGYEFSFNHYHLWRKNRKPVSNGCYGVDINRNYDIKWDKGERDAVYACADIYKGTHSFSEPETKAVANVMNRVKNQALMYISIHTYGNTILYPWGWSIKPHPNKDKLDTVGNAGRKASWKKFKIHFDVSQSSSGLYVAAGGSDDYALSIGIPFAFTLELGKEEENFAVPVKSLAKTLEYGYEVITAMILKASEITNQ